MKVIAANSTFLTMPGGLPRDYQRYWINESETECDLNSLRALRIIPLLNKY